MKERAPAATTYQRGDRVFHDKFGYGPIVSVDDDRLEIAFDKADTKRVLDRFVKPADQA
ncbi:hypothetical protein J4558_07430 [Leptolyngbya sp. 15MV]|nr:hypothetical protein J4558_07430 [Leptolyngbya sp. 15MV]